MRQRKGTVKTNDSENWRYYAADFETTTAAWRQDETRVWSFCVDEVGHYSPEIYGTIEDFFTFCAAPERGPRKRIYFHNLKFDGNFILWHLFNILGYKNALRDDGTRMEKAEKLGPGEVSYAIADTGQWYFIAFRIGACLIEVRDSLKIMPFTLEQVGKSFCKKYHKTNMEYDSKTSLDDCTPEDIEYIKNDVLVLSEALSFLMQANGEESPFPPIHSLTIGGACLQQFKETVYGDGKSIMPRLKEEKTPEETNRTDFDDYIRGAYRGGFCYVAKEIEGKTIETPGFTADVNSLYPFVMCTEYSGNRYPIGKGKFETGRPPEKLDNENFYYYMRVRVSFELRPGFVPTIQKKNSLFFRANAYLESSRYFDFKRNEYTGDPRPIEIFFSKDDWQLFIKHYKIINIKFLDYIWFYTAPGIFDDYIKSFAKIKQESKGAVRSLAKLFQNNLYGQMAKSDNSTFKTTGPTEEGLEFSMTEAHAKKTVNIAIGAAITAKARRYQIETIQKNKTRFCYSDTDSLHCIGDPAEFVGPVDDKIYGAYKIEATWKRARYVRQKTYIEEWDPRQIEAETKGMNEEERGRYFKEKKYINICAAGMTPEQKQIFRDKFSFQDFEEGLTIRGGKLKPRSVRGGVILEEVDFTIR